MNEYVLETLDRVSRFVGIDSWLKLYSVGAIFGLIIVAFIVRLVWPKFFHRAWHLALKPINFALYNVTKNEVFNMTGLRPKSEIFLNDVIRTRDANFAGRDPEPLGDEWMSDEDYTYAVDRDAVRGFIALRATYRTKRDYVAKNRREQGTAFVTGTATIREGIIRTRRPRALLIPFSELLKFVGKLHG